MSIRVAFIGAGNIASRHLEILQSMDVIDIVALCDIDETTVTQVANSHTAAAFTDAETMFVEAEFDCVYVCVPPFAHGPPELLAAEHGVDLFVEKPLGLTRESATEIHNAVEAAGIITQVGHMNRYADITERAIELIGDRDIAGGRGHWIGGVPSTAWWGVKDQSGGQIIEQATHIFDIIRYFLGEVDGIHAFGSQQVVTDAIDFEDATVVSLQHTDGTISQVFTTSASPDGKNGIELIGDRFRLELDFPNERLTGWADGQEIDYQSTDKRFQHEVEEFISAVRTNDPDRPRSPYTDAIKTFELTLNIEDALRSRDPVEVM